MSGFTDFVTAFATNVLDLASGGKGLLVGVGKRDRASHVTAPFFFITPMSEAFPGPRGVGASLNPRALAERQLSVTIESWGQSYDQTERLNAIAISAVRTSMNGGDAYTIDGADWSDPPAEMNAYSLSLRVVLRFPMPLMVLPPTLSSLAASSWGSAVPNLLVFDLRNPVAGKLDAGTY